MRVWGNNMAKKTKKVKKKRVQSKKKTVKKKKIVKKKTVKKKTNKKTAKKKAVKKKRKRKNKITMDDVYKILNKVQIGKKKITFAMYIDEADIAENVIKDLEIKYTKKVMKTQTVFTLSPSDADDELDILDIDYLDDEIPEEGQIFG